MGSADRIIQIIGTAILTGLYFTNTLTGILGIVLLVPAGVFVINALIHTCPLYFPFGISTCTKK